MPSSTATDLNGTNRWKHPHHAANAHDKDQKPTPTAVISSSKKNPTQDKEKLDKDVADIGTALAQAFNDVWSKPSGLSRPSNEEFENVVTHLQLQLDISNLNTSARCENASILDRSNTYLTPLWRIRVTDLGIEVASKILDLGVRIEYLEAFPNAYKAAMLYLIGINPQFIKWTPPNELKGGDVEAALQYLVKLVEETVEYPDDRETRIKNDEGHDWRTELLEVPDSDLRDPQLTRQLRVAVGLPSVSVGFLP